MALASVTGPSPTPPPPRAGDTGSAANVTRAMPRTVVNPAQGPTTVMSRTALVPQPPIGVDRRNQWYGIAALIALLALIAGGIVLYNVLKNDDVKAESFELTNVVGQPLDEAIKTLEADGLTFVKLEEPTDGAAEGVVVRTDPAAGTPVIAGQAITLAYNPAKAPVPIPDVKGKTVEEATSILAGSGFERLTRHRVRRGSGNRARQGGEHRSSDRRIREAGNRHRAHRVEGARPGQRSRRDRADR